MRRPNIEADLTRLVPGRQRAAVDQVIEDGHASAEDGHRGTPRPAQVRRRELARTSGAITTSVRKKSFDYPNGRVVPLVTP